MSWFKYFFVFLFLSGCGFQEIYIAHRVKFRILFQEEKVRVSFDLNPKYQHPENLNTVFEDLGSVFLHWNEHTKINEMGTSLFVRNEVDKEPFQIIDRFPNGKRFPRSVPLKTKLSQWIKNSEPFQVHLIFHNKDRVIGGGAFLNKEFNKLRKNSLATQKFYAPNGNVQATISLLGPTKVSDGGIFYFANFGTNPFPDKTSKPLLTSSNQSMEWVLEAEEPLEIIAYGDTPTFFKDVGEPFGIETWSKS